MTFFPGDYGDYIIPLKVNQPVAIYVIGDEVMMSQDHPFYTRTCPVCGEYIANRPANLVYVGLTFGEATGGGVLVHSICSGPTVIRLYA